MTTILLTLLVIATALFCALLLIGVALLTGKEPDEEDDDKR